MLGIEQTITNKVDDTKPETITFRTHTNNAVEYKRDEGVTPGVYGWYIDLNIPRAEETVSCEGAL